MSKAMGKLNLAEKWLHWVRKKFNSEQLWYKEKLLNAERKVEQAKVELAIERLSKLHLLSQS